MAAPPHHGTLRPWRGHNTLPIPSGTGAFDVTPSTSPNGNAVWTPSPAVAGSVQKGNQPALTASAKANQSMGRSLKHSGLGSLIPRNRSSVVTSITPVSAVVPDRDGPRPQLRADLDRLRAGNNQTLPVEQSLDSRHYNCDLSAMVCKGEDICISTHRLQRALCYRGGNNCNPSHNTRTRRRTEQTCAVDADRNHYGGDVQDAGAQGSRPASVVTVPRGILKNIHNRLKSTARSL